MTQKNEVRIIESRHRCTYGIALGSDMSSMKGLSALIHSILSNYKPINTQDKLCFFVFSTKNDRTEREQSITCAFRDFEMDSKSVEIIHKVIDKNEWVPKIYSIYDENQSGMEYKWFRYYLSPKDVDGLTRIVYLDSDTIVLGNISELFAWNLNDHIVAGVLYWEPLKLLLCNNHRLSGITMKTDEIGLFGFGKTTTPFEANNHLNTGVLIIDLDKMSKERVLEKWSKLLELHEGEECLWLQDSAGYADFSLAINGDYEVLPEEWNVGYLGIQEKFRTSSGCDHAKLLHWNGSAKPYTDEGRGRSLCTDYWDNYDLITKQSKLRCSNY